ncbi:hypothetical protein ASwh1_16 [Aeromonas phage Aswh_1]|nr:hypothetical protein ASwh1_16 [Aeromonas phage Aswh_1]
MNFMLWLFGFLCGLGMLYSKNKKEKISFFVAIVMGFLFEIFVLRPEFYSNLF